MKVRYNASAYDRSTVTGHERKAQTASAAAGAWSGHAAAWCNWLPSYSEAAVAYNNLPAEVKQRILDRAMSHGLDPVTLVQKMPKAIWNEPDAVDSFLDTFQVSHIHSQHTHPEMADDPNNWVWEQASPNAARRQATMGSEEFQAANDSAQDYANEFTGDQSWWDLNDLFKSFLEFGQALGYAGCWLPKEDWKRMMNSLRDLYNELGNAGSFNQRLGIAQAFTNNIWRALKQWKHHLAAAFMLAMLTIFWPPAALFIKIWGITSIAALATSLLRTVLVKSQKRWRVLRFFRFINRTLKRVQQLIRLASDIINRIKDAVTKAGCKVVDAIFTAGAMAWTKVVQPKVQAIVKKTKNLFAGFLSWCSGLTPAFA